MRYPVDHIEITQRFGAKAVDYAQFGLIGHHGCDCKALTPKPVYAPEDATVYAASNGVTDRYTGRFASGETIILTGVYEHWLMHLSQRLVAKGQKVKEGQLIGYTGATGFVTGPHLHWGVRPLKPNVNNGYRGFIDPMTIVKEDDMKMSRGVMAAIKFLATRQNAITDAEYNKYSSNLEEFVQYLTRVQAEHNVAPMTVDQTAQAQLEKAREAAKNLSKQLGV